jgi:hypothetical protein
MPFSRRRGFVISVSPVHFKKYLIYYKNVLKAIFKDFETGFVSDTLELYAQAPFLLKFALTSLIKEEILDPTRVVEFLIRKLSSGQTELYAVIIEVIDEIVEIYKIQGKFESLKSIEGNLSINKDISVLEKTLLQRKTLEFIFSN